jgi:hypothetical protein
MEALQFIFSGFWVWLGAFLVLRVVVSGIVGIFAALRDRNQTERVNT